MLQAKVVPEHVRQSWLEGVELRQRFLTNPEQDAYSHVRPVEQVGKRRGELTGRTVDAVVDEELLELVEDHVEVPAAIDAVDKCPERRERIVRPRADDGHVLRPAELVRDARAEQGALAHAARPVEDRES